MNMTHNQFVALFGSPGGGVGDPFSQYEGLDGETIDETDKGYTSTQIDEALAIFATCTNCTIDISGSNAFRTAGSNDDMNTILAAGNTIVVNETLGAEINPDPNFGTAGLWDPGRWVIASNLATVAAGGNTNCALSSPPQGNLIGDTYRLEAVVDTDGLDQITMYLDQIGGYAASPVIGAGTLVKYVTCGSNSEYYAFRGLSIASTTVVSKFSIKKVTFE